jgi:pSer/pThr/pTyr-binding forkhead associated (FHA) protein
VRLTRPPHRRVWHARAVQTVHLEIFGDGIELPLGETVIGRDLTCAVRLNDASVSRRHLRLVRRGGQVLAEDLGSRNGTLINGSPLAGALRLVDGDVLQIGSRSITLRLHDEDNARIEPQTEQFERLAVGTTQPPPFGDAARMGQRPIDRRRHDRRPVALQLIYTSSELEIEALTRDLSESGVFVCSQVLDPVGTACTLTLLVGGRQVQMRGTVRRVVETPDSGEPIGLGVEFQGRIALAELGAIVSAAAPQ